MQPCVHVLGVDVSVADQPEAIRKCDKLICSGGRGYICAADVHSVVEALRDPAHRRALNGAYLTVADGMPLVWIGRLRGFGAMRRVYGPDFLLAMCEASVNRGWRHFFYGGRPGVAEELAARLKKRFPDSWWWEQLHRRFVRSLRQKSWSSPSVWMRRGRTCCGLGWARRSRNDSWRSTAASCVAI